MDQLRVEIYARRVLKRMLTYCRRLATNRQAIAGFRAADLHRTFVSSCCKAPRSPYRATSRIDLTFAVRRSAIGGEAKKDRI